MSGGPIDDPPAGGWSDDPPPSEAQPASIGRRVGAFLIDTVVLNLLVLSLITFIFRGAGDDATGVGYGAQLLNALIVLTYFAVMEGSSGQTVAKRLLGVRVVRADGGQPTVEAAVRRRLPFLAGTVIPMPEVGLLVTFGLYLAILITTIQDEPEFRGVHDKWAATRVVAA